MRNNLLVFTIAWDIIVVEVVIFFTILILLTIVLLWFEKRVHKQFLLMNYEYVLKYKKILLFMNSNSKHIDDTFIMLAVSSFEVGKESDFEYYINKVQGEKCQASVLYWKCCFYFFKEQNEDFYKSFSALKNNEESEQRNKQVSIIEILIKKREGNSLSVHELEIINQTVSKKMKIYVKAN